MQAKLTQPKIDRRTLQFRCFTIIREKRKLGRMAMPAIQHIDGLAPSSLLAVVDFTKVEHLPLADFAVRQSPVLNDRPIPMFLTIFISLFRSQKHVRILPDIYNKSRGVGRHYKRFWRIGNVISAR
jgi:hypothetical protein